MRPAFSFTRWWGVVVKEFLQLRRDRLTFGMIVGIPVIQLLLFGYAINSDPKHLPTALVLGEQSSFIRAVEAALRHSDYFSIFTVADEHEARRLLAQGEAQFTVSVPQDFTRRLLRESRERSIQSCLHAFPNADRWQIEAYFTFVTGGCYALMERWIRREMKESSSDLADAAEKIMEMGIAFLQGKQP